MTRVDSWLFTALGFVMVLTPLALWISWTKDVFYALLIVWFAAYFGIVWLCGRHASG